MNQISEINANEQASQGSRVLIEHSFNGGGTVPSTACVSPVLEGKSLTNSYIESLLNSSQNVNQAMTTAISQNIGMGLNLGFGLNMNVGINELNSSFPLALPNNLYQVNNMLGAVQTVIPDCYGTIARGYNLNNPVITQNILPIGGGMPVANFTGMEPVLCSQSNLLPKEENLSDINSIKLDSQSSLINPMLHSPILPSIGSQLPVINPSILTRISSTVGPCSGSIHQNSLVGVTDQYDVNKFKSPMLPLNRETNIQNESDKLYSLLNSYLNNIVSLADAHERVKNYLNAANSFDQGTGACVDSAKLLGNVGMPDYSLGNVQLDRVSVNNFSNSIPQRLTNNSDQGIPGEPNDIFKISHTRKYRLGDQGRALLKSELSAYLRSHPEKRVEASKIADIRNATTKQLWQIAAMCGLEERFINLHAQSLAQSKGRVGLRGTKRRTGTSINGLPKAHGKVGNGNFEFSASITTPELNQKANVNTLALKSDYPSKVPTSEERVPNFEVDIQVEVTKEKSVNIEREANTIDIAKGNYLNLGDNEIKDNSIISADNDAKRIRVDTSSFK